jgi:multiple sugar transport system substrate-binding protein
MSRRRLVGGVLAAAAGTPIVGVVTGCGVGGTATAPTVEVSLWNNLPESHTETPPKQAQVAQFNSSQQRVHVTMDTHGVSLDKLKTATAGGTPPDAALIGYYQSADLFASGLTVDLDEQLKKERDWGTQRKEIFPLALETSIWRGKLAAMPFSINNNVIFFNPELLARAGVTPPVAGWTWDDFISKAKAASHPPDVYGLDLARYGGWAQYTFWMCLGGSNGFRLLSQDGTKVQWDTELAQEITRLHVDVIQNQRLVPPQEDFKKEILLDGATVFEQVGSFRMPLLRKNNFSFGVVANPVSPKTRQRYADGGGHSVAILRTGNADKTLGAALFAKYFSSVPAQVGMGSSAVLFPINRRAQEEKDYQAAVNKDPDYKISVDELPNTGRAPTIPSFDRFMTALGQGLLDAYAARVGVAAMHATVQPLLQGILDEDLKQSRA